MCKGAGSFAAPISAPNIGPPTSATPKAPDSKPPKTFEVPVVRPLSGISAVKPTLLTLSGQRRSRQNPPTTPIVEYSPHLDDSRASIGLPPNLGRGQSFEVEMVTSVGDVEKTTPERVGLPKSNHTHQDKDVEAKMPPSQAGVGQTHGEFV